MHISASALLLLAGLAGCSSTPSTQRVDPAFLAEVPSERTGAVDIARSESKVARSALANAIDQSANSKKAVELASEQLEVAISRVDLARVTLTLAHRATDEAAEADAARDYERKLMEAEVARKAVALARRGAEVSELRVTLATEEAELASARLDLAMATALEGVDMLAVDAVPTDDIRSQERNARREVELVNRRLSAARVDEQAARDDLDAARDAARAAADAR